VVTGLFARTGGFRGFRNVTNSPVRLYSDLDAQAPFPPGILIAGGPTQAEQVRVVATYIDRILKGTRPADLPIVRFGKRRPTWKRLSAS